MNLQSAISRPELILPEAEAERLRAAYAEATVILEYGSGGSTVVAAEMPDKRVYSVESDMRWARMMRRWFEQSPPAAGTEVDIIWSNLGLTRKWGYPRNFERYLHFVQYPMAVWDRPDFRQPDVVLVDGRFRTGCALATAFRTTRPVTVLFDDYAHRNRYHGVEEFLGSPDMLFGRMAEFTVAPMSVPADRLLTIIRMMMRP